MNPGNVFERITQTIERPMVFVLTWVTANVAAIIGFLGFFGITATPGWIKPAMASLATVLLGVRMLVRLYGVSREQKTESLHTRTSSNQSSL
jgi:cytochrome c biogenesis protein CcdA